jgi:hypothetical protein
MKCLYCNAETPVSAKTKKHTLYCNKDCMHKYWTKERGLKIDNRICERCGIVYMPINKKQRFCKSTCNTGKRVWFPKEPKIKTTKPIKVHKDLLVKKTKSKDCQYCGNQFIPYTSLDKFCSATCRVNNVKSKRKFNWTKEQTEKRVGDKNPAYRNGMYAKANKKTGIGQRLFNKNNKEIRQAQIQAVGHIYCENCKTSNSPRFEGHHLIFRSEKPLHQHLHDKENIYILCIGCHNEFHKNKSMRNHLVEDRKLYLLFGEDVRNK